MITTHIIDCAQKAIPEISGRARNKTRPWWNEECRRAREEQNKAWGIFHRYPTDDNFIAFKRANAKGKRTRRLAKSGSWSTFLSSINSYTDTRKVWYRIRTFKGQNPNPLPLISTVGDAIKDQANELREHFEHTSTPPIAQKSFYIKSIEQQSIRDSTSSKEEYICSFSLQELKAALSTFGKSASGADRIAYEMIKHEDSLEALFLFNKVWCAGRFPRSWKEEIVIPILKEGKEAPLQRAIGPSLLQAASSSSSSSSSACGCPLQDEGLYQ